MFTPSSGYDEQSFTDFHSLIKKMYDMYDEEFSACMQHILQGLYTLIGKTSYLQISRSLEAVRLLYCYVNVKL